MRSARLLFATLPLLITGILSAQPITRAVPFTLSTRDTSRGRELPEPSRQVAGTAGALHLDKDGHIVGEHNEQRVRFFGTELQWTSQFLPSEDARTVAKRLHKLGFNAVRLIYNDYYPYWQGASIFATYDAQNQINQSSYVLEPAQVARLDTLLFELKQQGIHIFLPLRSAHMYWSGDNVPNWDSTYFTNSLWQFLYPQAAQAEHAWARKMLAHVNPLTGLKLADDPSIAVVELSWEQSLFFYWSINRLNYINDANKLDQGLQTLSYHESRRLDTLFSSYLKKKYGNDAGVNAAWVLDANPSKANLLDNGSFEHSLANNWMLGVDAATGASASLSLFGPAKDSDVCAWVRIEKLGAQMRVQDITLVNATARSKADSLYEFSFWAKVKYDQTKKIASRVAAALVISANNAQDLAVAVQIDTTWRKFTNRFRASSTGLMAAAIAFGNDPSDVLIDGATLTRTSDIGLKPGESTTTFTVARAMFDSMSALNPLRARDQVMFYDSLEHQFFDGMAKLVRDTIKIKGLVNQSQGNYWQRLTDVHAYRGGEVAESHQGWDYVSQRGTTYSDTSWIIRNQPLVVAQGDYPLSQAGASSIVGKAFVLGQFTFPFPNQFATEHAIIHPAYAAYQDWDGIFFTPYATYREELFRDSLPHINEVGVASSANSLVSNHAFLGLMPAASAMFLNGYVKPAEFMDTIDHDPDDVWLSPAFRDYRYPWGVEGYLDPRIMGTSKVRQRFDAKHKVAAQYSFVPEADTIAVVSDTKEISWTTRKALFQVNSPQVYAFTGGAADTLKWPALKIFRSDNANDIFSVYDIPMDTLPLLSSKRSLLTISTRCQNTGTQWVDDSGFSYHAGRAPTVISAARVLLSVRSDLDSVLIYPLDSTGNKTRKPPIVAVRQDSSKWFTATIDQLTTPSLWFTIEHKQGPPPANSVAVQDLFSLDISANPMHEQAEITVSLPRTMKATIRLIDDLGREIIKLAEGELYGGLSHFQLTSAGLTSGHYQIQLITNQQTITRQISILK